MNPKTLEQRLQHQFTMRFDPESAAIIANYHRALEESGIAGTVTDTVRELVKLGASQVNTNVDVLATRARAFNLTRAWLFQHVQRQLKQLIAHLEHEVTPEVLKEYGLPPLPELLSPEGSSNTEGSDGSEQ